MGIDADADESVVPASFLSSQGTLMIPSQSLSPPYSSTLHGAQQYLVDGEMKKGLLAELSAKYQSIADLQSAPSAVICYTFGDLDGSLLGLTSGRETNPYEKALLRIAGTLRTFEKRDF